MNYKKRLCTNKRLILKMKAVVYQNLRIKSLSRFVTALMKAEQKSSPERRVGCRNADGEVYITFIHIKKQTGDSLESPV